MRVRAEARGLEEMPRGEFHDIVRVREPRREQWLLAPGLGGSGIGPSEPSARIIEFSEPGQRDGEDERPIRPRVGTLLGQEARPAREHVGHVVVDPDGQGPGVITERDILLSLGTGEDPDKELVADHLTADLTFAAPDWSLERAAAAMVRGGLRHLVVVENGSLVGILSMCDIVRCWTQDGATSEIPAQAEA